jgi:hypothetical protein
MRFAYYTHRFKGAFLQPACNVSALGSDECI